MTLPVLILAGGLATRLRPITETIPKALISIAGEPFIFHQLRLLARNNIKQVVISAGYLGDKIFDAVGNGHAFNIDVNYSYDGDKLLGTGGAIAKALPIIGDDFFVLYGDSYLDCDYEAIEDFFNSSACSCLMTIFKNEGKWDTSNVEFDGKLIVKYSKIDRNERMNYIDYGLGILNREVFKNVSTDAPSDLSEIYSRLSSEGNLAAYEVFERFYEIGTVDGIKSTEDYIRGKYNVSC